MSHPILRLDIVSSDGARATSHRVFCQQKRRSVPMSTCCGCAQRDAIRPGPTPTVDCTVMLEAEDVAADPGGEHTPVGLTLHEATSTPVVDESVSLHDVLRVLRETDRRSVAVVNADQVLVGVVYEGAFAFGSSPFGPHLAASGPLSAAVSTPLAVREGMSVRAALRLLAAAHLREATVITPEGEPLGVFRDIDGLRWIAQAQREACELERSPQLEGSPQENDATTSNVKPRT